ncbi:MAG: molybdopterin molybdotransferase MoeA [Chloroflexi bacterium]|nr:molybdopterin molybdotransferase MoeA [Chloroflexota bacterium]
MADAARHGRMPVDEARVRVLGAVTPTDSHEKVPLPRALGRVLVEDVAASVDVPPFDYSAMDGYAVRAADVAGATRGSPVRLRVGGRVGAGMVADRPVGTGEAWRVLTGAPIPPGADAVVPFEWVRAVSPNGQATSEVPSGFGGWTGAIDEVEELAIDVTAAVDAGDDIRARGEDQRAGTVAIRAGTRIRPAEVAVLASLGRRWVWATRRVRIGVLSTGDELVGRDLTGPLPPGLIRDANAPGLMAMVERDGAEPMDLGQVPDQATAIRDAFIFAVQGACDAIISSGGVSMGDRDMVRHVVQGDGEITIWSIDLRPGKPFAFGSFRGVPIFGLPGNPVSALVTYELLVAPAVRRIQGEVATGLVEVPAVTEVALVNDSGREQFMRGVARTFHDAGGVVSWHVRPTGPQGSGILSSMSRANCLIRLPATTTSVPAGGAVTLSLPGVPSLW